MNQEIQNRLLQSMDKVTEYIEAGENFVVEQSPLVVQEIITWGIASNLIMAASILLGLFIIFIPNNLIWFFNKYAKWERSKDYDGIAPPIVNIACFLTNVIIFIVFCVNVPYYLYQAAYPYFAPRLYIIETVTNLIGNMR